jgi:hypothetical protein
VREGVNPSRQGVQGYYLDVSLKQRMIINEKNIQRGISAYLLGNKTALAEVTHLNMDFKHDAFQVP